MSAKCLVFRGLPENFPSNTGTVVTIGNFDGIHIGHQSLIAEVAQVARQQSDEKRAKVPAVLLTFYPHPSVVLGRVKAIPALTPLRQKIDILGRLGIDILYLVHFTKELAAVSAADFLYRFLVRGANVNHVVLGPDTALGKAREGDGNFISKFIRSHGRSTTTLNFVTDGDSRISSRKIRDLISTGEVDLANKWLGRPYRIDGHVVKGDGRGKQIGFPTANLSVCNQVMPGNGVYATRAIYGDQILNSVTNVGVRPTFGGTRVCIESHLLNFAGNLYKEHLSLEFVKKLREEIKFSGIEELKTQIAADVTAAKLVL